MIKVALISHSPAFAGAERMLFNMALLLKNVQIYEPIVFIPESSIKSLYNACKDQNILTVQMPDHAQYIFISEENKNEMAQRTLGSVDSLINLIRKNNIDIIISNTATSVVPALAAVNLQIPIVGWIHGILDSYLIDSIFSSKNRLFFDRMLIALCDNVICCSDWTTRYYKRYDLTSVKTMYNWSPIPTKVESMEKDSNIFICLNTFDEQKGIYTLLEASAILRKTNDNFKVHFYGDGLSQTKDDMKNFIEKNDLKDVIKIMGRIEDTSIAYNSCLCLIQPSYIESFGMTIIEAMSYGRPVIATKSGGPDDIVIDEITGFLIDKDNSQILAEKMQFMLENKNTAISFGSNGKKEYNEKFSPTHAIDKIQDILNTTIAEYKGINKSKQLYADCLRMLTQSVARQVPVNVNEFNVLTTNKSSREIISNQLILSKPIKRHKRYCIHSQCPEISEIGVIFTTYDQSNPNGLVHMNIFIESKLIRSATVKLNNIVYNQWTYFGFKELKNANKKDIMVELNFEYEKGSNIYGVYEDKNNRTIIHKIYNKLGMSEKGIDVLFVDCRK